LFALCLPVPDANQERVFFLVSSKKNTRAACSENPAAIALIVTAEEGIMPPAHFVKIQNVC
jgi:hypothetical protein